MNANHRTQMGDISMWIRRSIAAMVLSIALWSTVGSGHETAATTGSHESAIPFLAVVGVSVGASLLIGAIAVVRWDLYRGRHTHSRSHWELSVVLLGLGIVALLAAVIQNWPLAVGGTVGGGAVAWVGRKQRLSPHGGCADAALGAVLAHRTVEGAVIASIYAASAAVGLVGLGLLTAHMTAETAAVGGLYAPLGRWWAAAAIVVVQLAFVGGALAGEFIAGILPVVTVPLVAAVGGVLFVAGGTEFQTVVRHRRTHSYA